MDPKVLLPSPCIYGDIYPSRLSMKILPQEGQQTYRTRRANMDKVHRIRNQKDKKKKRDNCIVASSNSYNNNINIEKERGRESTAYRTSVKLVRTFFFCGCF